MDPDSRKIRTAASVALHTVTHNSLSGKQHELSKKIMSGSSKL